MSNNSTFGQRLAAAMGDIAAVTLAARIIELGGECTERTVYRWLQGDSLPQMDTLIFIGKALDVSLDTLAGTDNA